MNAVDSKKQQLSIGDIIRIAGFNTNSPYDTSELTVRLTAEMSDPRVTHMVYGNTLFIIDKGEGRNGYMRALNADTAENFIESSKKFADVAYALGFDVLVTQFKTPSFLQIFRDISKALPRKQMGYKVQQDSRGNYVVTFALGPRREGSA
jgi:hypothetical protein